MIASLTGAVAGVEGNAVVVDVHGVGYVVYVPLGVLAKLPEQGGTVTLHTVMAVREDDISLYGFSAPDDRELFRLLTSVSGVGPKVALSMLSVMESADLARAIAGNDIKALTRSPGVGPKLAQRVVLDIGERVASMSFTWKVGAAAGADGQSRTSGAHDDVVEALVNLGYSRADSRKTADRVVADAPSGADTPVLIRLALNLLSASGR